MELPLGGSGLWPILLKNSLRYLQVRRRAKVDRSDRPRTGDRGQAKG